MYFACNLSQAVPVASIPALRSHVLVTSSMVIADMGATESIVHCFLSLFLFLIYATAML